ncbi:MAG: TIGR02594 family protein [Nitrospira sp.]|nr:TIGR02594 family protein [Nitrospira sp.]MDH4244361.1 TIGR02594 family protein [Nitrospira sp.]MDH4354847.1 TIGR02594 family protein [Nitrospira sp.]MDH5317079.1 TIGR02594 family protein [Nitrospira sp.]
MTTIELTAFDLAQRFVGIAEVPDQASNPHILAMLRLDDDWPQGDEVAWCSAFLNYVAWLLRLPRSKDLLARSWLRIGQAVSIEDALVGFDVVVFKRRDRDPGSDVIDAPGHAGFFAGRDGNSVLVLGGNQSDSVNVSPYPIKRLLGVRRLLA